MKWDNRCMLLMQIKLQGQHIIVETKPAGTEFLALDNQVYKLNAEDLMICDGNGHPMCIGVFMVD
jgi:phenylalanyl-tRNA synthetase beta chain